MSDSEEPPVKVPRVEVPEQPTEGDEEWLNEDALTDDDSQSQDSNRNDIKPRILSEDSAPEPKPEIKVENTTQRAQKADEIGLYFNQFKDSGISSHPGIPSSSPVRYVNETASSEAVPKVKGHNVGPETGPATDAPKDGECHSTADLLRILGEEVGENASAKNGRAAVNTAGAADVKEQMFSSDEDIFEGVKLTTTQLTKSLYAKKSKPEMKTDAPIKTNSYSREQPLRNKHQPADQPSKTKKIQRAHKSTTKNNPVLKTGASKRKEEPGSGPEPVIKKLGTYRSVVITDEAALQEMLNSESDSHSDRSGEDSAEHSDSEEEVGDSKKGVREEEAPTDCESDSGESDYYSYNDVMMSSDSDNVEELFSLDIRGERAGDYIPLMGQEAQHILEEERTRAGSMVAELRRSLADLNQQNKKQSIELEEARKIVRELNMQLKTT